MQYSTYKKTGEQISKLGFGLMRLPKLSESSEDIDFAKAAELVDIAIKNGVNYFDTAYVYNDGNSEEFVGEILAKYPRESFYLASKLPGWLLNGSVDPSELFEFQRNRCNVDYFDFFLIHSITDDLAPAYENAKAYEKMMQKKEEGKIRNLGFSFHGSMELYERWLNEYDWDFVQIQLNYYDWKTQNAEKLYRILEERDIPCIVMEPVRGGSLHTLNDEAKAVFSSLGNASPASYALRFAAQLPNVLTVLSGMSNEEQVRDNIKTFSGSIPLSEAEMKAVNEATVLFRKNFAIPCTACRYCVKDCPQGVHIPEIFSSFNEYNMTRSWTDFTERYDAIPAESRASACIECNKCTEMCPQRIDIPKKLKKIRELDFD